MQRPRQKQSGGDSAAWPAQANGSLVSGIDCLLRVAAGRQAVGCRELARELGMEPTKANRLLGTLAALGLVARTGARKYEPGPGLHVLGAMALRGSPLLSVALPHLRTLSHRAGGRSVALGVRWRRQVCYLFHGTTRHIEAAIDHRFLFPAERSSIGQVLLASLPVAAVRDLYAGDETRDGLPARLANVRKQGYALNCTPASGSMAVPIGAPAVAGLAVVGVMPADAEQFLSALQESARLIERDLNERKSP
jgi:DNA-binding IclR family transcriptional regulator